MRNRKYHALSDIRRYLNDDLAALVSRKLPIHTEKNIQTFSGYKSSVCLCLLVPLTEIDDGFEEWIARFADLMRYLVENQMVGYAQLGQPFFLPLKGPTDENNTAILWHVFSDYSREELNDKLGANCFVKDGCLYGGLWPEILQ